MTTNNDETMFYDFGQERQKNIKDTLKTVYESLEEKGYNPINQIVGYIVSEDPTYITNYNNSRAIISKIDRDELLRTLVEDFIAAGSKKER